MSCSETATGNPDGLDVHAVRGHVQRPGALLADYTGGTGERADARIAKVW